MLASGDGSIRYFHGLGHYEMHLYLTPMSKSETIHKESRKWPEFTVDAWRKSWCGISSSPKGKLTLYRSWCRHTLGQWKLQRKTSRLQRTYRGRILAPWRFNESWTWRWRFIFHPLHENVTALSSLKWSIRYGSALRNSLFEGYVTVTMHRKTWTECYPRTTDNSFPNTYTSASGFSPWFHWMTQQLNRGRSPSNSILLVSSYKLWTAPQGAPGVKSFQMEPCAFWKLL